MKKKLLLAALGAAAVAALSLGCAACNNDRGYSYDGLGWDIDKVMAEWTVEKVYARAKDSGYTGTVNELEAQISAHEITDLGTEAGGEDHEHVFPEWTIVLQPACDSIGISFRQCTLCREAEFSFEEALPHTFGPARVIREATCEEEGVSLSTCTVCGFVKEDILPLGEHTFEEGWTSDATHHWHSAVCGHDAVSGKEAHTFEGGVCTVCGKSSGTYLVPVQYTGIAKYFGENITPWEYLHNGVDFIAEAGTPVFATAAGTVTNLGGDMLIIAHDGNVKSHYRCLDIDPALKVGDTVKQGQQIGTVMDGPNYESEEAHLCFELTFDEQPEDPLPYLGIASDRRYLYD